jgi:hypothetical protein
MSFEEKKGEKRENGKCERKGGKTQKERGNEIKKVK